MRSTGFELDKTDVLKTLRDFAFVIGGVALTFAAEKVVPLLQESDNFMITSLAVPAITAAIALGWRFVKENQA